MPKPIDFISDFLQRESAEGILIFDERLGIIIGSLRSGALGALILHFSLRRDPSPQKQRSKITRTK